MVYLRLHFIVAALACLLAPAKSFAAKELGVESLIYVGTRTDGKLEGKLDGKHDEKSEAKGIYLFRMRTSDDPNVPEYVKVMPLGVAAEADNPTFLVIDGQRKMLFCVNEIDNFAGGGSIAGGGSVSGGGGGAVSAYSIEPTSGKLTLLNQVSSMGARPCHLALDRTGKFLLVANSGGSDGAGANVAALPIGADGKLGEATDVKIHAGKSVHPEKQTGPHPSGVVFSADNRFAFVCDLGLDKIMIYRFDAETGKLTPHETPSVSTKAGAGPRHLVFSPDGKFAYLVNALNSTATALAYDSQAGMLTELQTVSTLPEYYDGPNHAAEIGLNPTGRCLLVSNCGHQSIVLFHVDAKSGLLSYVDEQSTYGTAPRHFGMQDGGKHFVVANQDSGSILILRAPENDRVKPAGNVVETPSPTCAVFLPK